MTEKQNSAPQISPLAFVDPSAKIGRDVTVKPFAYIDADVTIGDGCNIMPYASVMAGTTLGRNVKVYQGAIVGADPQDFRWKGEPSRCEVGDNCVIREHAIINRSIHPDGGITRIGNDTFIMAGAHIAHDTVVRGRCVIGNAVKIAGDAEVGECSILSSGVIVHEKSRIGDWCLIKGGCRISGNVPPFVIMAHNPAAYFGVNTMVMQRGGFSPEEIDEVAKAYRHIYQSGTSVFNAMRRIHADLDEGRIRDSIVRFVAECKNRLVAIPRDLEE